MWTETQIEIAVEVLKESPKVSVSEFDEFLEYRRNVWARQRLFYGLDNPNDIFSQPASVTSELNRLSTKIIRYEEKLMGTPIYDELLREKMEAARVEDDSDLPEFLRDNKDTMSRMKEIEVVVGWYQNSKGDLFHYDGTIWDSVPSDKLQDLEFLG
jgi:hypothetical protein